MPRQYGKQEFAGSRDSQKLRAAIRRKRIPDYGEELAGTGINLEGRDGIRARVGYEREACILHDWSRSGVCGDHATAATSKRETQANCCCAAKPSSGDRILPIHGNFLYVPDHLEASDYAGKMLGRSGQNDP